VPVEFKALESQSFTLDNKQWTVHQSSFDSENCCFVAFYYQASDTQAPTLEDCEWSTCEEVRSWIERGTGGDSEPKSVEAKSDVREGASELKVVKHDVWWKARVVCRTGDQHELEDDEAENEAENAAENEAENEAGIALTEDNTTNECAKAEVAGQSKPTISAEVSDLGDGIGATGNSGTAIHTHSRAPVRMPIYLLRYEAMPPEFPDPEERHVCFISDRTIYGGWVGG
jgi:hypothetical protein